MKDFLFLLRAGTPMSQKTDLENKADQQAWGIYMGNLAKGGHMVGGQPLQSGGAVVSESGVSHSPVDSPDGILGGYMLIKAADLDSAIALSKDCPHIANKGNIEVREIAPMPAM